MSTKTKDEWKALLEEAGATAQDLEGGLEKLALYAANRTQILSTLVGQPGFEQAYKAERDNVALRAGVIATDLADAADARIFGAIAGGLRIGATAIAGVV